MNKVMKYKQLALSIIAIITLMLVSCDKQKTMMDYVSGDDKNKIDLKGSLMSGDMRYVNIYAELVDNVVYVYFNEPVENCGMTLTTRSGDVLYARRMAKHPPATLRIFMGNEPTGDYQLYITNGVDEASGWFHFDNIYFDNISKSILVTN